MTDLSFRHAILFLSIYVFFPLFLSAQLSGTFSPIGNEGIFLDGYGFAIDAQSTLYSGGCQSLYTFDGTEWVSIHSVFNGTVDVLSFDSQGNLYVGGDFDTVAGMPIQHIAKWDGTSWSGLGAGVSEQIGFLEFDGQDNLYTARENGIEVMKWDGTMWDTLDGDIFISITTLAVSGQGQVYAGGWDYTGAGYANILNQWNGTGWDTLIYASNYVSASVDVLEVDNQGNLYISGDFGNIPGLNLNNIGRWDGMSWDELGGGLPNLVSSIAIDDHGIVYASSYFEDSASMQSSYLTRWDGTSWSAFANGLNGRASTLSFDDQAVLYALGSFERAGSLGVNGIAQWTGNTWLPVGKGGFPAISTFDIDPNGQVFIGGAFFNLFGNPAQAVGVWDGSSWQNRGGNLHPEESYIDRFVFGPQNQIYVSGYLESFGQDSAGEFLGYIAQWNGTSWDSLGSGLEDDVNAIAIDQMNNIYVDLGWAEGQQKWDGNTWASISANLEGEFYDLICDAQGTLYGAGEFSIDGNPFVEGIASYDGSSWTQVGGELDRSAYSLTFDTDGMLYIGGNFELIGNDSIRHVAKWNGSNWEGLANGIEGYVNQVAIDANGFLYASGEEIIVEGYPAQGFAIWDGMTWLSPDLGSDCIEDIIYLMRPHPNGSMLLAGEFTNPYPILAFWTADGLPNSLEEFPTDLSLSTYPNPSTGLLTIDSPDAAIASVKLFDFSGREISTKMNLERYKATLVSDYTGIALLHIQTEKGLVVQKIVFQ